MIELRPVDDANRDLLRALQLKPGQERFVTSVTDSMTEAVDDPGGRAILWGLYDGETPVGFVMISDEVDGDDYFPHYLWKLSIDGRRQGRGYGRAALDLVVEYFRARPGVDRVLTSCVVGDGGPLGFYEAYGFVQTGDIVFDGELLLRLDL